MASYSFDIVSEYDKAEIINAYEQTKREISNRYDFKDTPAAIDWLDSDKNGLKVTGNSAFQIDAITDIFRKKLAARNQSQKVLDTSRTADESNLKVSKDILFKKGLDQEKAKTITSLIRNSGLKVKTQIQGELVRVTGSSKNDLQSVISLLKSKDLEYPLQFVNYR